MGEGSGVRRHTCLRGGVRSEGGIVERSGGAELHIFNYFCIF